MIRSAQFFFVLFANALAFFREHQRLRNVSQTCFYIFFRSEAFFDYLFFSDRSELAVVDSNNLVLPKFFNSLIRDFYYFFSRIFELSNYLCSPIL